MTNHDWRSMKLETVKLLALAGEPETRTEAVQELYRRANETKCICE